MVRLRYVNGQTDVKELFRELVLYELPDTARSQSATLRGRLTDHLLSWRRVWRLAITTEASVNDVLWIRDFWTAETRYIQSPFDEDDDANWVRVRTPDGRCPITYRDDIIEFPEAALELYETDPQ
jgi:hypothetical protein